MKFRAFRQTFPPGTVSILIKALLVMKLTIFLVATACLQANANGYGQVITLSVKNAPIEKVFTEIQRQSSYNFIYTQKLIENTKPITLEVKDATIEEVLLLCLRGLPITYTIEKKFIVIKRKEPVAANNVSSANFPIDVKGRVVNEKGEAVEGVTVTIKGTDIATSTNAHGEFALISVDREAILVFTSVNMETFELKVNGKAELVVSLKTKITALGEVTVELNTGYQILKPNEVTGSVATVGREQLDRRVATDIISKLEGITSGLVFNRNRVGTPTLSIRGRSTIYANSDPLIVLDNFPYDGDLNNINPNDIESITVLKDAAAASIWGVRAGNGVIVITTKKGKINQRFKIGLNTNITIEQKPDLFYDKEFLNSSDYIDVETFLFNKGHYTSDLISAAKPPASPVVEILNKRKLGQISAEDSANQIDAFRNLDIRNEFVKYFYQRAVKHQYAINMSGGSTNAAYFMSVGFDKNESNLVRNENDRITVNSLVTIQPIKNFEFSGGMNYIQSNIKSNNPISTTGILTGGKFSTIPYLQLADQNGNFLSMVKDYRDAYVDTAGGGKFLDWHYYPLNELALSDNKVKLSDTRLTAGMKYTILKGLSAEVKYQFEKGTTDGRNLQNVETYFTRNLINKFTAKQSNGSIKHSIPVGAILDLSTSNLLSTRVRMQINYTHKWVKHEIAGFGGAEITEVKVESNRFRTYGYDPENGTYVLVNFDSTYNNLNPNGASKIPSANGFDKTLDRFRSFWANIAYSYNNLYSITFSARADQSNLFGVTTNHKTVPLWSIGGRWDISDEAFYKIKWLPRLTLRATYGYNGNINKSLTSFLIARYSGNAGITGAPYAVIQSPENPELRWEKIGMFNIGLDFELVSKVLSGSFEYFHKNGVDLIGDAALPSSTGVTRLRGNFSNMTGKGIDLVINSKNIDGIFEWKSRFLFSHATDKVKKFYRTTGSLQIVEGRPVEALYSIPWAGLDPATGDPRAYLGDTISKIYNAMAALSNEKLLYNGPTNPVIYGGFQNIFSYKMFELAINISYKAGYYFRRSSINYSALFNNLIGHQDFNFRWNKPGDEIFTNVPSLKYPTTTARESVYRNSSILVERGDHIRLEDISLSYDLSNSQMKKELPFDLLRLYIYANNLGILWRSNKLEIDPDRQSGYPIPLSISFGLRAYFR